MRKRENPEDTGQAIGIIALIAAAGIGLWYFIKSKDEPKDSYLNIVSVEVT